MRHTLQPRSDRIDGLTAEVLECLNRINRNDVGWREDAACIGVNPEIFFPQRGEPTAAARSVCDECPVRIECLTWSLLNGETRGIWGGVAERTRRTLRRRLPLREGISRPAALTG